MRYQVYGQYLNSYPVLLAGYNLRTDACYEMNGIKLETTEAGYRFYILDTKTNEKFC